MNTWLGIVIILGIIFLGAYGGNINNTSSPFRFQPIIQPSGETADSNTVEISVPEQYKSIVTSNPAAAPTPEVVDEDVVTDPSMSKYSNHVSISYVSNGSTPNTEYVQIRTTGNASTTIPITGWTLISTSTGRSVKIPKAIYLYFADSQNYEQNIVLGANETVYLITGYSPNGASFKVNKCSGYLQQFQTFKPALPYSCPAARNENLSSIPKTVNNDACFDYIDGMPPCRIQTEELPANWSYECTNFIYNKVNYPSCINVHKADKDFYKSEWRVYLQRSEKLWKDYRETVVLYDNDGKIVSKYEY